MAKQAKIVHKKPRGRPPGLNFSETVPVRLRPDTSKALDAWADAHDISRSEAIRRFVEQGLSASHSFKPQSPKTRAKAAALAAETIDRHTDQSAAPEEQASRKRRLLKGPKEFRAMRKDHK